MQVALLSDGTDYCFGMVLSAQSPGLYGGVGAIVCGFENRRGVSTARLCGVVRPCDLVVRVGHIDVTGENVNTVRDLLERNALSTMTLISLRRPASGFRMAPTTTAVVSRTRARQIFPAGTVTSKGDVHTVFTTVQLQMSALANVWVRHETAYINAGSGIVRLDSPGGRAVVSSRDYALEALTSRELGRVSSGWCNGGIRRLRSPVPGSCMLARLALLFCVC